MRGRKKAEGGDLVKMDWYKIIRVNALIILTAVFMLLAFLMWQLGGAYTEAAWGLLGAGIMGMINIARDLVTDKPGDSEIKQAYDELAGILANALDKFPDYAEYCDDDCHCGESKNA